MPNEMPTANSIQLSPYDLPDAELLTLGGEARRCKIFIPPRVLVVIGKGSDLETELHGENVLADNVPVMRRATGGCAVVLTPRMIAVAFALFHKRQQKSSDYFRAFNDVILRALAALGVTELEHAGTSDLARRSRKIAGTALYRNRELVFFHAVINVADGTGLMERYLKSPPRMPDYREGRSHTSFVTSLVEQGFHVELDAFRAQVETEFRQAAREKTGGTYRVGG